MLDILIGVWFGVLPLFLLIYLYQAHDRGQKLIDQGIIPRGEYRSEKRIYVLLGALSFYISIGSVLALSTEEYTQAPLIIMAKIFFAIGAIALLYSTRIDDYDLATHRLRDEYARGRLTTDEYDTKLERLEQ